MSDENKSLDAALLRIIEAIAGMPDEPEGLASNEAAPRKKVTGRQII